MRIGLTVEPHGLAAPVTRLTNDPVALGTEHDRLYVCWLSLHPTLGLSPCNSFFDKLATKRIDELQKRLAMLEQVDGNEVGAYKALDTNLQKLAHWNLIKREFPDWYEGRLRVAVGYSSEPIVTKFLTESLVGLRRQHAQAALAASTEKLKAVATAFLANLRSLKKRSTGLCHAFISQGETAPDVLKLLESPDQGAHVNRQILAIFEAIAEGRKSPTTHAAAVKSDYEVLVGQLTKLGWRESDLKIFSEPKVLARQPPDRICEMVQDWFVAHLAVQDPQIQQRLLFETLKPIVSG